MENQKHLTKKMLIALAISAAFSFGASAGETLRGDL